MVNRRSDKLVSVKNSVSASTENIQKGRMLLDVELQTNFEFGIKIRVRSRAKKQTTLPIIKDEVEDEHEVVDLVKSIVRKYLEIIDA